MATQTPPPSSHSPGGKGKTDQSQTVATKDVELLRVLVTRDGKNVSAQWAIHPQMKHDLLPDEWKEVSDLMKQVTDIVGTRFSELLSDAEPDPPGSA